jgi:hypothetical protein
VRIDEFASAEEQLALWKIVSDNVWSAIATQAEQERRARAEKAARSKPKRGKRSSSPKAAKPPAPRAPNPAKTSAGAGNKAPQQAAAQQPENAPAVPAQPNVTQRATGTQAQAPIQPIPPVASSSVAPQVPQPVVQQAKPRITARAGGLTV